MAKICPHFNAPLTLQTKLLFRNNFALCAKHSCRQHTQYIKKGALLRAQKARLFNSDHPIPISVVHVEQRLDQVDIFFLESKEIANESIGAKKAAHTSMCVCC